MLQILFNTQTYVNGQPEFLQISANNPHTEGTSPPLLIQHITPQEWDVIHNSLQISPLNWGRKLSSNHIFYKLMVMSQCRARRFSVYNAVLWSEATMGIALLELP